MTRRDYSTTIVADSAVTLDGLALYFDRNGIATQTLHVAEVREVSPTSRSVVLFPDDFDATAVLGFVVSLRRARPGVLLVVVTRECRRFETALAPYAHAAAPVVLPRPSFGWSIVDVIRAHQSADAS